MHARVTQGRSPVDRLDGAIQQWSASQQDITKREGFRGNMLLVDRETGEWQIIGLWDALANIEATATPPASWEEMVGRGDIVAVPTVKIYERAAGNPDPKR
jgi:hypothetical protein